MMTGLWLAMGTVEALCVLVVWTACVMSSLEDGLREQADLAEVLALAGRPLP